MRWLSRREFVHRILRISSGAGAALLLGGCGGSSPTDSGDGGDGGTGGFLSADARAAALDAVSTHFASLPHSSLADDNQRLLSFLNGNSAFTAAGSVAPGTVWARFTDGTPLAIVNDGTFSAGDFAASARMALPAGRTPRASAALAIDELPDAPVAYLSNNIAPTAVTGSAQWPTADYVPVFASMQGLQSDLETAGYQVTSGNGTVAELNALGSAGVSVLYMVSRLGLMVLQNGSTAYALSTSQPTHIQGPTGPQFDVATYNALKGDIQAGRIAFLHYVLAKGSVAQYTPGLAPFYAITPAFIAGMHFPARSFVFLNGCAGGSKHGVTLDIAGAFTQAGAGVLASWDNPVDTLETDATAGILLPTMAGVPSSLAATPPRRAFSATETIPLLEKFTRPGSSLPYDKSTSLGGTQGPANLIIGSLVGNDRVGILAPSIGQMTPSGDSLLIYGSFGNGDGSGGPGQGDAVVAGGINVTNVQWSPTRLTALVPAAIFPGGEVKVRASGIDSNPVRLTAWKMTFDYDVTLNASGSSTPDDSVSGTYTVHATIEVWIRADLHLGRASVTDDPPSGYSGTMIGNGSYPSSLCTVRDYSIEGEITHVVHKPSGDVTVLETTAPDGMAPYYYDGSSPAVVANSASFSLLDRGLQRDPGMLNFQLQVVLPSSTTILTDSTQGVVPFAANHLGVAPVLATISVPFDSSGHIAAGQVAPVAGGALTWIDTQPMAGSWPDPSTAA